MSPVLHRYYKKPYAIQRLIKSYYVPFFNFNI
jgi:hypothetical protein